ncbi:hypothetical protein SH501x_003216 [Pirellulaceae bacterium SH501]
MHHHGDWFHRQCESYDKARSFLQSSLANQWNSFPYTPSNLTFEQQQRLLANFQNFAALLEIDRSLTVRFATNGDVSTACASFRINQNGRLEDPLILLNPDLFRNCRSSNFVDVATGVFLHEVGHILYTRNLFDPREILNAHPTIQALSNLVEDARIEDLLIKDAPGWAPYIYAARQQLLIEDWLQPAFQEWDESSDTDKIVLITSAYLRVPYFLREAPEKVRSWCDLGGRCIFDTVSKLTPRVLNSELDVSDLACDIYYLIRWYANQGIALLSQRPLSQVTEQERERLRVQIDCDARDFLNERNRESRKTLSEKVRTKARAGSIDELKQMMQKHHVICEVGEGFLTSGDVAKSPANTFGIHDQFGTRAPSSATLPRVRLPKRFNDFRVVLQRQKPVADNPNYRLASTITRSLSQRLRGVFQERRQSSIQSTSSRVVGQLDARRLWKAAFSKDVFSERVPDRPRKILLILLLDASGSMFYGESYLRAFETAVMLNEAFLNHSHVDVRIFAHSTEELSACVVTDYGDKQQARKTLDAYHPMAANFDFLAIQTIISKFSQERDCTKILISISDGQPCMPSGVLSFDNLNAIAATKSVVEEARKRCWTVVGVEIGKNGGEQIYGEWNLQIRSGTKLPIQIASLATKLLRRALA